MSTELKTTSKHRLTRHEIDHFHEQGWLGPYQSFGADEMATIRKRLETEILGTQTVWGKSQYQTRHLDNRQVYELCTHPAILDRVECLLGPDLVLWQSNFFLKEPGSKAIPWHQDLAFWPIEPPLNISAWIAIDLVTIDNSCVQLISGSHRTVVPHIAAAAHHAFPKQADPNYYMPDNPVKMELQPGEFFLFTERLLHHSTANQSNNRRMGLAVRLTTPIVRCYHEHPMIIVRGEDRLQFNAIAEPTPTESF